MKSYWEYTDFAEFKTDLQKFGEGIVRRDLSQDCRFLLLVLPEGTEEAAWVTDLPGEAAVVKELEAVLAKLKGKGNK